MRKPYTIIDHLNDDKEIEIDLFEINLIAGIKEYTDEETGDLVRLDDEYLWIAMNDETVHLAKATIEETVFISKQMWKAKMKDCVRNLFKDY